MPPPRSALSAQLRGGRASLGKRARRNAGTERREGQEPGTPLSPLPTLKKRGEKGGRAPPRGSGQGGVGAKQRRPRGGGLKGTRGGAEGLSAAPSAADGRPEVRPREPSPHPAPFLCCLVAWQPPDEPQLRTHPLTAPSRPEPARLWRSRRPPTRRFPQAGSPASPPPPGASQPRKRPPRVSLPRRLGQSKRRGAGERHGRRPMSCEHLGKLTGPRQAEGAGRSWRRLPDGAGSQSGGGMMSWGGAYPGRWRR